MHQVFMWIIVWSHRGVILSNALKGLFICYISMCKFILAFPPVCYLSVFVFVIVFSQFFSPTSFSIS